MIYFTVNTIFLALGGSQAYGTAGPDSDIELHSVCIAQTDRQHNVHYLLAHLPLPLLRLDNTPPAGLQQPRTGLRWRPQRC